MELNFKIKDKPGKNFTQREAYLSIFKKKGFPNKREEEWKFTDLEKILNDNFKELSNEKLEKKATNFKNLSFNHNSIKLVNGKLESFDFKLENFKNKNMVLVKEFDFDTHLNLVKNLRENQMQNLNTALQDGGFSLNINSECKFKYPIVIYNYFSGNLKNKIINNSKHINISKNSNATIMEYLIDESQGSFFKNTFKYFNIDEDSSLNYFFINKDQSKNFFYEFLDAKLSTNANFKKYIFSSGVKFCKFENSIQLKGTNSRGEVYSGLFLKQHNHQEIKINIQHLKPNCQSHQDIKKVLTEGSKGVFQGKIFVDQVAQKTNAYQLSKGLLLDENTEFNTKPELEIYADDVKCSHGSTSGNIDKDALFYLKARGIKEKEAIKMIIKGFLESVLKNIENNEILNILLNHFNTHIKYESRSN
mgnify:CR=1 FL=1